MSTSELTLAERKRIREQLQREDAQGESLDPATKCKCPDCGIIHFRPRKENNEQRPDNTETARD